MKKKKEKMKICLRCKKPIKSFDKQVEIITRDKLLTIARENFHWQCWLDEFKGAVRKQFEHSKEKAMEKVKPMMQNISQVLQNLEMAEKKALGEL